MKKVGIVTLHGYFNYGNRLQNYALLKTLEKLNLDVYSCNVHMEPATETMQIMESTKFSRVLERYTFTEIIGKFFSKVKRNSTEEKDEIDSQREKIFKEFSNEYLNEVTFSSNENSVIDEFSYFIAGSDQVWNPVYFKNLDKYFLDFAPKEKRFSYAASISVDTIPEYFKGRYKYWLENMSGVSVREVEGANIVRDLIGKDVPVHVDPTMLLTSSEWRDVSKRASNRPDTDYILTYFLGDPPPKAKQVIDRVKKNQNITIINLADKEEVATYKTGPREFLDYIDNAKIFLTDSFHGVVYSILFNTPFLVYERASSGASMYSRIETILNKFSFEERKGETFSGELFDLDFSNVNEILNSERKRSIDYLTDNLNV